MIGIYRIINNHNGKKYIGQSLDIHKRWKQHTHNLKSDSDETILRRAFVKYGLYKTVNMPGVYNGFTFEVIHECEKIQLLEKEYFYIQKESPEYNIMCMDPNSLNEFKHERKNHADKTFIQYHNYDIEKHYPGIDGLINENDSIIDCVHYISTRKKIAPYLDGATILLIIGKSYKNCKKYFLWTKTIVDEMEYIEEEELSYNLIGDQYFIKPILLNNIIGFTDFLKEVGNFGFGITSIHNKRFFQQLINIVDKYQVTTDIHIKEYLGMVEDIFA